MLTPDFGMDENIIKNASNGKVLKMRKFRTVKKITLIFGPYTTRNMSTCDLDYWSLKGHCFSFATFL